MERQLVNTRQCGQVTIAIMPENIDSANSATVQGELLKLCQGTGKLLCDFAANKYVSSAGLRVFLEVLNAVEERSGALCLLYKVTVSWLVGRFLKCLTLRALQI